MFIADFHIHSKYSRATSKKMEVPTLAKWAKIKGIQLLGTGDFTHHLWLQELKNYLQPQKGTGLYTHEGVHFVLSGEISSIFSQGGRGYRVHNLVVAPSFEVVQEINQMLACYGNIASDGRPIIGISCFKLAQELSRISQDIMLIPAHIWTPWFGVLGSKSGFNSLAEAYGEYTENITALETGLSSDPPMNWRLSELDKYTLVSNSDSHSPSRIGREANVFNCQLNYWEIKKALETKDKDKFLYTIEFFPQEGKYHLDGHRNCDLRLTPKETLRYNGICPRCQRPLTKGVLYRVQQLANRDLGFTPKTAPSYKSLIPFDEIVAEVKGVGRQSKSVTRDYFNYVEAFGSEFNIMVGASKQELFNKLPEKIAQGVIKVRGKDLIILPGYDGTYGKVQVFSQQQKNEPRQMQLF
jgi:uncharacterized protein (TIGR00375 family)